MKFGLYRIPENVIVFYDTLNEFVEMKAEIINKFTDYIVNIIVKG
jgi:hypothetical protein